MVVLLLLLLVGPIVVSNVDVIVIEVYAIILSCVFNNKTLYNVFYCFSKYSTR